MQLGVIGIGRMGGGIVRRLQRAGHQCVVFDLDPSAVASVVSEGAIGAGSFAEMMGHLRAPRAVWVMLPHGRITAETITALGKCLSRDDMLIDGGNSFHEDDVHHAAELEKLGIRYLDVGTSGGIHGLERGYCMMIGGDRVAFERLDPIFAALCPGRGDIAPTVGAERLDPRSQSGYLHCGPAGAGHFVKMIHNGIEYGMMQAIAEGFDIMRNAAKPSLPPERRYALDLPNIAEVWRRGSVVSSWLLDLTATALTASPSLSEFSGVVEDSGEGRWTVQAAIEEAVPAEVLTAALYTRFRSRQDHTFAEKMLSAMRAGFGGHVEPHRTAPGSAPKP